MDMIKEKHDMKRITFKGRKDILITNKKGNYTGVLGFKKCLSSIIKDESDPLHYFLLYLYNNMRSPEYHGWRLGDNIVFEIDDLIFNLVKAMNYLFLKDLDLPFNHTERKPFTVPIFKLAGTKKLPKNKVLLMRHELALPSVAAEKWY